MNEYNIAHVYWTSVGTDKAVYDKTVSSIEFVSQPTLERMVNWTIEDLKSCPADRVLVVADNAHDNYAAFSSHSSELTPREVLVNHTSSLGWLLKVCEYSRAAESRQIIVSPFPRRWAPPTILLIQTDHGRCGEPGSAPGQLVINEAADYRDFFEKRSSITLNLPGDSNRGLSLAIYFVGLRAVSYYHEVVASQDVATKDLMACKVVSGRQDVGLFTEWAELLGDAEEDRAQAETLRKLSVRLEDFCTDTPQKLNRRWAQFNGSMLVPSRPERETLPSGVKL